MSTSYLSHLSSRFDSLLTDFATAGADRRSAIAKDIEDIAYCHGQQAKPDAVMLADHVTMLEVGYEGLQARYIRGFSRGVEANPVLALS